MCGRRILTAIAAVVVCGSITTVAVARTDAWRVIGKQGAAGDYAVAVAAGTASHPTAVAVRVLSSPSQRVSGSWTIVCARGFGSGSKSGNFTGRTPLVRTMRMPMSRPDSCTASASAQLDASGRLIVQVLKR